MAPRGLIGLGKDTLDYSKHEIHRVFSVLCEVENYPILLHCMSGKDRTGLIIILILLLMKVDILTISADYLASERLLEVGKEARLREIRQIGLGDEFAGCPQDFVDEIRGHLDEKYDSIGNYLNICKVDVQMQGTLREKLLSQS